MPDHREMTARMREVEALRLAVQPGITYDRIAEEIGYANRSGAWKAVQRALGRELALGVAEMRQVRLARIDAMAAGLWPKATTGDEKAVNAMVALMRQEARYVGGLEESPTAEVQGVGGTIVVELRVPEPDTTAPAVPEAELEG